MPKPQSPALKGALAAFAPKLKHLLDEAGLSEPQLGSVLKRRGQPVSPKTINNLGKGRHNSQLGNLAVIADYFGVPLWVMLIPDLPLEIVQGEQLKRLDKLMRDYIACDEAGRQHTENIAAAYTKAKAK